MVSLFNSGSYFTPLGDATCVTLASRRVLPYMGTILGEPYQPAVTSNWPTNTDGSVGPRTINSALDLVAGWLRGNNVSWSS